MVILEWETILAPIFTSLSVSGYLRPPEFKPQAAVEKELDTPVFRCTHWVFSHLNLALPELPILVRTSAMQAGSPSRLI